MPSIHADEYPISTLADLDDDGDYDLVVGVASGELRYFQNVGDAETPRFVEDVIPGLQIASSYSTPAFGDLDGDGDLDLVVGAGSGFLSYLENVGNATNARFNESRSPVVFAGLWVTYNSVPTLGDVDGDLDLIVGDWPGSLTTYRNVGNATVPRFFYVEDVQLAWFDDAYYSTPTLADVDEDGDLDVVVGSSSGYLSLFQNFGGWRFFEAPVESPFAGIDVGFESTPALGDLDDDGDVDLVIGNSWGSSTYYLNVGDATTPIFESVEEESSPFAGIGVYSHSAPVLADLDGDADLDLVIGEVWGTMLYYRNIGDPRSPFFRQVHPSPFDGIDVGYLCKPAFVDLDNDGDLDLVVGESEGHLLYFRNVGGGGQNNRSSSFERVVSSSPFVDVGYHSAPIFADLDNDGDLDMIIGELEGVVGGILNYYLDVGGATTPKFEEAFADSPFANLDVGTYSAPAVADLDNDGDLDLVVGVIWGTLASVPQPEEGSPFDDIKVEYGSAPAFGDLDGDADLDLLLGSSFGNLAFYPNVGDSTTPKFLERSYTVAGIAGNYSSPALADLDNDGDLDLLVGARDGNLSYYLNIGKSKTPRFERSSFLSIPVGSYSMPAFADLDNDGDLDLILGDAPSIADLDNDGRLDVVVVGEYWGNLYYYFRNKGNNNESSFFFEEATETSPFKIIDVGGKSTPAFGDLDGDADLDVLVGNWRGDLVLFTRDSCATNCNGYGLCSGNNVFDKRCDCLIGFAGNQCDACQDGYFGLECETCPQGGGEDRDRPRLTDICGVANSGGRSRGRCDDGKTGSGKCACFSPFNGTDCLGGECPPGSVEVVSQRGLYYLANCTKCSAGTYASKDDDGSCRLASAGHYAPGIGASEELPCPPGSFAPGSGQAACARCDAGTFVRFGGALSCTRASAGHFVAKKSASTELPCPRGTFASVSGQSACARKACEDCCVRCENLCDVDDEECVACDEDGAVLETLDAKRGWWRASHRSLKVYECPLDKSCRGGPSTKTSERCYPGHVGALCGACDTRNLAILSLLVAVLALVLERRYGAAVCWTVALVALKDQIRGGADAETQKIRVVEDTTDRHHHIINPQEEEEQLVLPRVRFPPIFSEVSETFGVVGVALFDVGSAKCVFGLTYFHKLAAITLGPLAVIGRLESESDRRQFYSNLAYATLLFVYVCLPSISTPVITYFSCRRFDRGDRSDLRVVASQLDIRCTSARYKAWALYDACMIALWPVGVTLGIAVVLWRNRSRLDPDVVSSSSSRGEIDGAFQRDQRRRATASLQVEKIAIRNADPSVASLEFLFEEYEPRCFTFPVFEVARRLFLSGVIAVFYPGSMQQVAMLGSMVSYAVYVYFEAYVEDDDDLVSTVARGQVVPTYFASVVVYAADAAEQKQGIFSSSAFGVILLLVFFSSFICSVYVTLVDATRLGNPR
ncbi:hypothetical protein CTAYLR_004976 [Chrysophaeum taylorii]|uniref:EGF-like domain-containing protein n=1 Tax=Chrysophaeum taylorii TaxID=2483200 RepID=A0AAD7UPR0_9STRA|nr:hypothetical protein CTAYLR_004976 [Chrysophaeum taylorii]